MEKKKSIKIKLISIIVLIIIIIIAVIILIKKKKYNIENNTYPQGSSSVKNIVENIDELEKEK